jgi:hypothetical protein
MNLSRRRVNTKEAQVYSGPEAAPTRPYQGDRRLFLCGVVVVVMVMAVRGECGARERQQQ